MATLKHFAHDHDLELSTWAWWRSEFMCIICNSSFRYDEIRYICTKFFCYGVIHKECAELPEYITSHPFHNNNNNIHSLTLSQKSFNNICDSNCNYCNKPFSFGKYYTYSCDRCPDLHMHATCAMVPLPTPVTSSDDDDDDAIVRFTCHQHPMMIQNPTVESQANILCFVCRSPWSSTDHQLYSCMSKECHHFFHKSCGDRLHRRISHPFHPRHHPSLSLKVSKPRCCDSCCKKDCRLIYTCVDCGFSLCAQCANYSTTTLQCQTHDHLLSFVERSFCDDKNIRCDACLKSYSDHKKRVGDIDPDEVSQTRSLLFRCLEKECSFDLHFLCGPLPVRVKFEYHIHPLKLVDSSTIKVDCESDEYYCDACEQKRDPQFRVYYCADCKYVAHIHCVLLEIMKVIKANTEDVELQVMGENRWDGNFDTKLINNDHSKENDLITMKDIMSSLTEEENQMLAYPFDYCDPFLTKDTPEAYDTNRRNVDSFLDREKSIEDVARVQKLFNFDWNDYYMFEKELDSFVLEEGLRLDEKHLRQKVEDVKGYKVPKTVSPILSTLLHKYGDLDDYSDLTPGMRSVCATLLCVTIDTMCKTKVEDLTRDDLKHFYFYLHGISDISGFKMNRYLESFDQIKEAFFGFEVNRFEKEVGEKLDVKIKTFEAGLKRYTENREKLKTYTSFEKSFLLKKFLSKAYERRGKYCGDEWF